MPRKYIGEILLDMEAITATQLKEALAKQKAGDRRPLGAILIEMKACSPEDVARAHAEQLGLRFFDLETFEIPTRLADLVPANIARERKVLPVMLTGKTLTVVMANPMDLETVDTLRFQTALAIDVAVASQAQIEAAIERLYGVTEEKVQQLLSTQAEDIDLRRSEESEAEGGDDAVIIKYVTQIIQNAITARASDIHVEPMADHLRIRYRIDGVCITMEPAPKRLQGPVTQRLKIMAGMQIEEKRRPQDGRIKVKLADKRVDLRVSCLPCVHGEAFVMRILDQESLKLNLEDMGFDPGDLKLYTSLIRRPNGIILVTGPTGSGKTTTLYATLHSLNTIDRKIITAEDPVEYHLSGINQCQVHHKIGLDFPRILRAMLRQAPNVILVGEIRDAETAQIAIQASLTGHLVFSTLHTNDAPSAITRLIDMGVQPFLVATSIQAVLAQRLIRVNCPKCAQKYKPDVKELLSLNLRPEQYQHVQFVRGRGCDYCKGTGYRGRKGIFEMMVMNRQLRDLAFDKAPTSEIRKAAIANGMNTLAMDGVRKVLAGMTTPDEVLRMAKVED
ncbi:MAG: GspE/PulE family protein [Planctomycetota bacterium]|nr:GspE/PulE family protein [Planctomycetota bacterium]MDW8372992.1 GspE/PulE family protein [Planctomycetota bacterium]